MMMPATPYDLIRCSWPQPVETTNGRWLSEPDWDAPAMPAPPAPQWQEIDGVPCWTIDWRAWFRSALVYWQPAAGGEMRGFQVVFQIRLNESGTLVFYADDGCIIRHGATIVHEDRASHPPARSEIAVRAGEVLEIAQWQDYGGWTWGAHLVPARMRPADGVHTFLPYLDIIRRRMAAPEGPPLKMYFGDGSPLRTVLALYSLLLNGYSPTRVLVFGDYQWSAESRVLFQALLPFCEIVPADRVLECVSSQGTPALAGLAQQYWSVMKVCAGVLYPPHSYCFMDDDVFILDRLDDALHAFQSHNLVFTSDADYGDDYRRAWGAADGSGATLPTGRVNTGLYWLRHTRPPQALAAAMLKVPPSREPAWQWDQGFIATQFAGETLWRLPHQRYFYPYFDGLPGGIVGYDYETNPCGFASIHFGGLAEKPSDHVAAALAPRILGRSLS